MEIQGRPYCGFLNHREIGPLQQKPQCRSSVTELRTKFKFAFACPLHIVGNACLLTPSCSSGGKKYQHAVLRVWTRCQLCGSFSLFGSYLTQVWWHKSRHRQQANEWNCPHKTFVCTRWNLNFMSFSQYKIFCGFPKSVRRGGVKKISSSWSLEKQSQQCYFAYTMTNLTQSRLFATHSCFNWEFLLSWENKLNVSGLGTWSMSPQRKH